MSGTRESASAARPARLRRKDARPSEIINAGLQIFAEKGFAAARLDDVAARAGVVKGTIYRYFADKEALFVAVMQAQVSVTLIDIETAVDRFDGGTRELLMLILAKLYAELVDNERRALMRIVIAEGANFPVLAEFYHREVITRGRGLLKRVIDRGIARGEIRPSHVSDLPMVLMAPALMAAIWKMTFDPYDPVATETFLAAHIDLLVLGAGLRPA